jgi:hypothetical protein
VSRVPGHRSTVASLLAGALMAAGALACANGLSRSVAPGGGGGSGSGWGGGGSGYPQPGVGFVSAARLAALGAAVRSNDAAVPWATLRAVCEQLVDSSPHPHASYFPGATYTATGPVADPADKQVQADLTYDGRAAYTEALCFRLTTDSARARVYASTAERFINAWVAQGLTQVGTGVNVNLTFALGFGPMTVAADLLGADGSWDPRPYRTYLLDVVLPHNDPDAGMSNLAAWDLSLRVLVGAYIDDAAMVDSTRQRWLFLADTQVAPDGSLRFEICRSNTTNWCGDPHMGINGLAYSNYDLGPMAIAAEVFAHRGQSVWGTPQGAKMGLAYATTAHWTLYPEASPYYAHNNGQLTVPQPPNCYVIFQRHFPNADGAAIYAQNASKSWALPYWTEVIYGVNVAD